MLPKNNNNNNKNKKKHLTKKSYNYLVQGQNKIFHLNNDVRKNASMIS